jgi:hypothetical protein
MKNKTTSTCGIKSISPKGNRLSLSKIKNSLSKFKKINSKRFPGAP